METTCRCHDREVCLRCEKGTLHRSVGLIGGYRRLFRRNMLSLSSEQKWAQHECDQNIQSGRKHIMLNGCIFQTEYRTVTFLAPSYSHTLPHFLSLSLSFSGSNTRPPACHTSATWKTQNRQVKCLELFVPGHHLFLHLIGTDTTKKARESHSIGPQRPIHPPVIWLSSHAKCGNAPSCIKCRSP